MARRSLFRRIVDWLFDSDEPPPRQPPRQPPRGGGRRPPPRQPPPPPPPPSPEPLEEPESWAEAQAQQIWNDTVSDIANNVDMEGPFVRFVAGRLEEWSNDQSIPREDTRELITWMIVNSGLIVTHDDITAVLDRIYQSILASH